ncbi:hypothetical protein ACIRPQ_29335 [Streptomyces sp. NPDC101213]|uniref:hypothetical protein n=1 Tax=Streptomyces sp. NPDC101213 TaxID=3366130 RepID=UPI00382C8B6D
MSMDIEAIGAAIREGLRDKAALRRALGGLKRSEVVELWLVAGEVAEAKHRAGLAAWARQQSAVAAMVMFASEDGKDGPQWSDKRVEFLDAHGKEVGVLASAGAPALVPLLDKLTEVEPPAFLGDEVTIGLDEAQSEEGDPWTG